jgi:hypothetical protein
MFSLVVEFDELISDFDLEFIEQGFFVVLQSDDFQVENFKACFQSELELLFEFEKGLTLGSFFRRWSGTKELRTAISY